MGLRPQDPGQNAAPLQDYPRSRNWLWRLIPGKRIWAAGLVALVLMVASGTALAFHLMTPATTHGISVPSRGTSSKASPSAILDATPLVTTKPVSTATEIASIPTGPTAVVTFVRSWTSGSPSNTGVLIATDGSGQVLAKRLTANVGLGGWPPPMTFQAQYVTGQGYSVPSPCPTGAFTVVGAADSATQSAFDGIMSPQIQSLASSGYTMTFGGTITIAPGSSQCSPAAGTTQTGPFQYQVSGPATYSIGVYRPQDVVDASVTILQNAVPTGWVLYHDNPCTLYQANVPPIAQTPTSAVAPCVGSYTAVYDWTQDRLNALANQLAGQNIAAATSILSHQEGIQAIMFPTTISISDGGSTLPSDPSRISFKVQTNVVNA